MDCVDSAAVLAAGFVGERVEARVSAGASVEDTVDPTAVSCVCVGVVEVVVVVVDVVVVTIVLCAHTTIERRLS